MSYTWSLISVHFMKILHFFFKLTVEFGSIVKADSQHCVYTLYKGYWDFYNKHFLT